MLATQFCFLFVSNQMQFGISHFFLLFGISHLCQSDRRRKFGSEESLVLFPLATYIFFFFCLLPVPHREQIHIISNMTCIQTKRCKEVDLPLVAINHTCSLLHLSLFSLNQMQKPSMMCMWGPHRDVNLVELYVHMIKKIFTTEMLHSFKKMPFLDNI